MLTTLFYRGKTTLLRPFIHKRGSQCFIISYPKCGRTWLRLMIGKALCDQLGLPEEQMLDTYRLTAVPGVLRTHFTHDYADIRLGYPYRYLPLNKSPFRRAKVIFLTRDVRDTLVSSYFQATKRVNRFQGSMAEFVRNDRFGVRKIVSFYNGWYAAQKVPRDFLWLRYEDLHRDPAAALRQTLAFMELDSVAESVIDTAVAFARFDNMKKMESKGRFDDDKMKPGQNQDADSFKVRQGKVGGFTQYLDDADLDYIYQTVQKMGCPWCLLDESPAPPNLTTES